MACRGHCAIEIGYSISGNLFPSFSSSSSPTLQAKGMLYYPTTSPRFREKYGISETLHFRAFVFPKMRRSKMLMTKAEAQESNFKKANLFAERKQQIKLPNYTDGYGKVYPFEEFLSHPLGIESILNRKALRSFQSLDACTHRCTLPKVKFLSFEVSPVLVLRVTTTNKDCTVEMLSCKFEGSEAFERQNDHFSAFMRNHITWDTGGLEPCLDVDVKLNVSLEVFTRPFTLLPVSAIETPGNLAMQGLVDRLVPLLVQQLSEDYEKWIQAQSEFSWMPSPSSTEPYHILHEREDNRDHL